MNTLQQANSWVALVTPFTSNNHIDVVALQQLCQFHIDAGTDGILVCGTTGEGALLDLSEFELAVKTVVNYCHDQVIVYAGTGSNNPKEAVEMTLLAESLGVSGTLHAFGYYLKPNNKSIIRQFQTIHDASQKDIMLYDIPGRNAVSLSLETLDEIYKLPRVVATKDATADMARSMQCKNLINQPNFCYYSGDDFSALAFRAQGGHGCISVASNIFPKLIKKMHQLFNEQKIQEAMIIQQQLMPLYELLFVEPNPCGVKYALSVMGLCEATVRAPFIELEHDTKLAIDDCIKAVRKFEQSL